ncbi:capsid protein (plasmid) [Rhizobium sp. RCAM05350]|nr:capsid protein [Rhizobium sp. RCAM05350]
MSESAVRSAHEFVSTPSARTLHAELMLLCARIGYSPPVSL